MRVTRIRMVVLIGASLYLAVMAFAGGVAAERIRYDRERAVVLHRHDEAVREWQEILMMVERRALSASAADDAGQAVP